MSKVMLNLIPTKHREDFDEIVGALSAELGPRFAYSLNNWCGIGTRPYPLSVWEMFLAKTDDQVVGICSFYRQIDDRPIRMWVGWIGVLPQFRRQKIGSEMLSRIENMMLLKGARESWVYADEDDKAAQTFYIARGYKRVGTLGGIGSVQAAATEMSTVFMKSLISAIEEL